MAVEEEQAGFIEFSVPLQLKSQTKRLRDVLLRSENKCILFGYN